MEGNGKNGNVQVSAFKWWWRVSWEREGKPFEFLFKKVFRAKQYAHLLENGVPNSELEELERMRLR